MRFRNGKKKIGLIALLSCVFTATVAFAAYSGYNLIQGTVDILAAPVEMVFADTEGNEVSEITAEYHADITGFATASDLMVETNAEGMQVINNLEVGLSNNEDKVVYSFKVKNNGVATAYLSGLEIDAWDLPEGVTGVDYEVKVGNGYVRSLNGTTHTAFDPASSTYVAKGDTAEVTITVSANGLRVDPESSFDRSYTEFDINLGQIRMTWDATDPNAE